MKIHRLITIQKFDCAAEVKTILAVEDVISVREATFGSPDPVLLERMLRDGNEVSLKHVDAGVRTKIKLVPNFLPNRSGAERRRCELTLSPNPAKELAAR